MSKPQVNRTRRRGAVEWRQDPILGSYRVYTVRRGRDSKGGGR